MPTVLKFVPEPVELSHVEWWAHSRGTGAAHQLHYDVNESVLRRGAKQYIRRHPVSKRDRRHIGKCALLRNKPN